MSAQKLTRQLDRFGYYLGDVAADESPLEPDVFLLPGGAVDAPAPDTPANMRAKWDGAAWIYEPIPANPEPSPAAAPTAPQSVTPIQALTALDAAGLLPQIDA